MSVAWYRLRATFRRRRTGYLSVVLLIGLVGGLALASVAGARRTDSSFSTYLTSTDPSTMELITAIDNPALGFTSGYDPRLLKEIGRLPLVEHSATAIVFDGNMNLGAMKGVHFHLIAGASSPTFLGSLDGEYSTQDRVTLVKGRLANPNRAGEAVLTPSAAEELGVQLGSVISMPFYTDSQTLLANPGAPHLVVTVKFVGEVLASDLIVQSDLDTLSSSAVLFSPALTRELARKYSYASETSLKLAGGDASIKRVLSEMSKVFPEVAEVPVTRISSLVPTAQQAIAPEAIALGVFGGIAGLATLLIAGLIIGRSMRLGTDDAETLRALGANRAMLFGDELAGVMIALLIGALLAVLVATGLSPLTPLGPVRRVYPNPGVAFDRTVLGLGFLGLLLLVGLLAVLLARREVNRITFLRPAETWKREPRWLRSAVVSLLPISAATGLRFAFDPGRGRNATPVRSAVLGAVLAVTVLVATVTFGASLDSLVSHPPLYGWNWSDALLASFAGQEDLPSHQITTLLNEDHDIQAWSGVNFAKIKLDELTVNVLAERPGARVEPPLLSGHGLTSSDEIVLGVATMVQLHKRVGDTVTFNNGASKPITLVIVGTATMPTITKGVGMGTGALVATSDFPKKLLNIQGAQVPGPNAILVRIKAAVSPSAGYQSLERVNAEVNALPDAAGLAGGVVSVLRPAEIVNFRSMGATPAVLAGTLAVAAIAALGLTLVASVRRRRRDIALLKALGFTQRQLAVAIAWQAAAAAVVGAVVGIPLGIVVGRELWTLFARSINAVPAPTVSIWSMILVGAGALVFANLVAAIPGRTAARTPTALVLRAE
jgi:hypothetical protein